MTVRIDEKKGSGSGRCDDNACNQFSPLSKGAIQKILARGGNPREPEPEQQHTDTGADAGAKKKSGTVFDEL
ncbi:MAG TPA: hypothetical protein VGG10_15255 [Rhizomicrobium sp.]|jgi:hypothetical protein